MNTTYTDISQTELIFWPFDTFLNKKMKGILFNLQITQFELCFVIQIFNTSKA